MKTSRYSNARIFRKILLGTVLGTSQLPAWTPGTYPVGSADFTVDTAVRNDVVSFWHGVYQASEGYWNRHGWTGNYTAAGPYDSGIGTTSAAFVADVERRVNFYRALSNVPAGVHLNTGATVMVDASDPSNLYHPGSSPPLAAATTKAVAAQCSAYMIARTYGYYDEAGFHAPLGEPYAAISHDPAPSKCVAWSTAAWNANHMSNLALGFYGPGAIDAYMVEDVSGTTNWNSDTGHRRMLLHPVSTDFATGDTPGSYDAAANSIRPPTNALYVVPKASEIAAVPARFVAYPPAGFFPAGLNPGKFWSLSYPGAGFGSATVTMTTTGGAVVPVAVVKRGGSFGYPAIIWDVTGTAGAVKSVTTDTPFNVTVAGITGAGVPPSYSYSVTLINPDQITSDQSLFGAAEPATAAPTTYQFTPPPKAEAIQVNCFQPQATAWTEGAEDGPTSSVIANTTGTYAFRSTVVFPLYYPNYLGPISGSKSFRLTFPVQSDPRLKRPTAQSFELGREMIPGEGAALNFMWRRGLMTPSTNLIIESSNDDGASWTQLPPTISGNSNGNYDTAGATWDSRSLAVSANPVRVRFRLFVPDGQSFFSDQADGTYFWPNYPTGIFIDDISTTNCQSLDLTKSNDLAAAATGFELSGTTAGVDLTDGLALRLRLRTKLGNRWMPHGAMKALTFKAAAPASAPVFIPAAGAVVAGQTLTITGGSGSTIFYRVNGGAEQSAASPVTSLLVPAFPDTLSIKAYAKLPGLSDSAIVTASYTSSPFTTWINTSFPGVSDAAVVGMDADPDRDGQLNLLEFALGGNPDGSADRARIYPLTTDGTATRKLLLTIAVRAGTPVFTGSPSPAAATEGVTYTILGGLNVTQWDSPVAVVTPPQTAGLPPAPAGYEYRTFKLLAADGLPAKGFLRVRVASTP